MRKALNILLLLLVLAPLKAQSVFSDTLIYVYKLHGQTRKYQVNFDTRQDTLIMNWGIERNTKWQSGTYKMIPAARKEANSLSFLQPEDGKHITLPASETFGLISQSAFRDLKQNGQFIYNGMVYHQVDNDLVQSTSLLIKVTEPVEGTEMWILDNLSLPVIWKMKNNPLEINWEVEQVSNNPLTIRDEIKQCQEKSGSIYYAYPNPESHCTTPPEGYTPFYISHYGRHGSRWIPSEYRYQVVLDAFSQNELTPLGKEVNERLQLVWNNAKGNAGQLTPLGKEQHEEIASRMHQNFPSIFQDNSKIYANSSVVTRCIKSMEAFTNQLQQLHPKLNIISNADSIHMQYIAYESPEMAAFKSKDADWYKNQFSNFEKANIKPQRLLSTLFVNPEEIENPMELMLELYWITSNMQDVDLDLCFYDLFTEEELFNIWQTINYRMYICNGASPLNNDIPLSSSIPLLRNITDNAEAVINGASTASAHLRFGHDTYLLRLLTLMKLEEFSQHEQCPELYYQAWQDYKAAPMAANLQLIFYKNESGDILVKFLHNEEEKNLSLYSELAPYYKWEEVKEFWGILYFDYSQNLNRL